MSEMAVERSRLPALADVFSNGAFELVERGLVPDALIRAGIRRLCRQRLREVNRDKSVVLQQFVRAMARGPIAPVPEVANRQHYELPAAFFDLVLGPHRKYSGCVWSEETQNLLQAEVRSLELTCERANLQDGMDVLELGCGWGSLTLWMAERYPKSSITAVSNSRAQRQFIERVLRDRGLQNVKVITADMNDFDASGLGGFDRVVSVEMFEHMRNWRVLLHRIAHWLRPDGRLFVHIFCHRSVPYEFHATGSADWMGRHFFTGGIMPSFDLFDSFDEDLQVFERWWINGRHYSHTANAWLANLDSRRAQAMPLLIATYGHADAKRWFNRWRVFFMACAELFGAQRGEEWGVGHYLLQRPPGAE